MRAVAAPRHHLFVCANRREGSPLGSGCGDRGEALYDALKREVNGRGHVASIWVTKTHCLGICPKDGATCARYPTPPGGPVVTDVVPTDAKALVDEAERMMSAGAPEGAPDPWSAIEHELATTEELHTKKVLDLARRLKPGLTGEDIQNPHDFPELTDPDWHYADGILTGVKTVSSALRALRRRGEEG
jgi:predicted metal-binding protein